MNNARGQLRTSPIESAGDAGANRQIARQAAAWCRSAAIAARRRIPASSGRPRSRRRISGRRLPIAIRTDNGVPFATQVIHGLSYLHVWWTRLGIVHQRSRPGCPQDNGAHERLHRTLKRQAIKPVRASCAAPQRNFDAFQREYNTARPHERLGQETRHRTTSTHRAPTLSDSRRSRTRATSS
jgi:transposase InsO family protein